MRDEEVKIVRNGYIRFYCPVCEHTVEWSLSDDVYNDSGCCGVTMQGYTREDGIHAIFGYGGRTRHFLVDTKDDNKVKEVVDQVVETKEDE